MKTQKIRWGENSYELYKITPSFKKICLAGLIGSIGLIIPDGSISFMFAGSILSPIGFRKALKNKLIDLKDKLIRIKYRYLTK